MCQNYSSYWAENMKQDRQNDCPCRGYILMRTQAINQWLICQRVLGSKRNVSHLKWWGKNGNELTLKSIWPFRCQISLWHLAILKIWLSFFKIFWVISICVHVYVHRSVCGHVFISKCVDVNIHCISMNVYVSVTNTYCVYGKLEVPSDLECYLARLLCWPQ